MENSGRLLPRRWLWTAGIGLLLYSRFAAKPSPSATPSGFLDDPDSALAPPRVHQRPAARPVQRERHTLGTDDRILALTLDDGPHPDHTPDILDVLQDLGIPATFFVVGENLRAHPELLRRTAAQGHQLANHTWSHPALRRLPASGVREELERTSDAIAQLNDGLYPRWFRAPGGDFDPVSLQASADLGMQPLSWSVDPQDWRRPGAAAITRTVMDAVHPGAVILSHDGGGDRSNTVDALRSCLPRLLNEGYRFVTP